MHFLLLLYHSESFLSKLTKSDKGKDICFAKMLVKMMAKMIFERAVMLRVFTGPVFIKPIKFICFGNADSIVRYSDI